MVYKNMKNGYKTERQRTYKCMGTNQAHNKVVKEKRKIEMD